MKNELGITHGLRHAVIRIGFVSFRLNKKTSDAITQLTEEYIIEEQAK